MRVRLHCIYFVFCTAPSAADIFMLHNFGRTVWRDQKNGIPPFRDVSKHTGVDMCTRFFLGGRAEPNDRLNFWWSPGGVDEKKNSYIEIIRNGGEQLPPVYYYFKKHVRRVWFNLRVSV